jgi:hypothetical protein
MLIVNSEEQDPVSQASDGKHPKNYSHMDCDERIQAKVRIIYSYTSRRARDTWNLIECYTLLRINNALLYDCVFCVGFEV